MGIQQGTGQLDHESERLIQQRSVAALEEELVKLVNVDDGDLRSDPSVSGGGSLSAGGQGGMRMDSTEPRQAPNEFAAELLLIIRQARGFFTSGY